MNNDSKLKVEKTTWHHGLFRGKKGQTTVEWILIIGIVAVVLMAMLDPFRKVVLDAVTDMGEVVKGLFGQA